MLERAVKAALHMPVEDVLRWGWFAPGAASAIWDDNAIALYDRQARVVRDAGALGELPIHLHALALERAWLGDVSGVGQLIAESEGICRATGVELPPFAELRILALQGREAEATRSIEAVVEQSTIRARALR